jgi:hypothetical protein
MVSVKRAVVNLANASGRLLTSLISVSYFPKNWPKFITVTNSLSMLRPTPALRTKIIQSSLCSI